MDSTTKIVSTQDTPEMYSTVLESCIGVIGKWQILVFLLVFLVNLPLSLNELGIVFLAPPIDFTCANETLVSCINCTEYKYDTEIFTNTIVTQWNLVCDDHWLADFAQVVLMLGVLTGNFIFGFISDKYGRRTPLILAVIFEFIIGVSVAFVPDFWMFLVFRFLLAVAAGGTLVTAFVIVVEIIGRKYRPYFGILFQMTYYFGHALLGLYAYFIRDWRYLQLTISFPIVLLLSYYWLIPESPRWLLTLGRYEEAIAVLEKAAKCNKLPTEPIRNIIMTKSAEGEPPDAGILDLFRKRKIRKKTLCICFNWIILGLSFFGVAQYMGKIAGNIFLNNSMAGLIQIPGNAFLLYGINRFGRKKCAIFTYLLCGIACLLIIVVPKEPTWIISFLGCIGMMSISLAFATVFLWSGEIFPTVVRNVGMGTAAMCAKFGSMAAPFVDELHFDFTWMPPMIFGTAPIIAVLFCLLLPETLDTAMPDTVEEAEHIG